MLANVSVGSFISILARSRLVRFAPDSDRPVDIAGGLFSLRQGSCNVTGVVDEKLRDRTKRISSGEMSPT
jgi:hypothetical protein